VATPSASQGISELDFLTIGRRFMGPGLWTNYCRISEYISFRKSELRIPMGVSSEKNCSICVATLLLRGWRTHFAFESQ
jgi:hypothetical protein